MRLLPYERLTLYTEQPADVVEAKLADSVASQRFSFRATPQPFRGTDRVVARVAERR